MAGREYNVGKKSPGNKGRVSGAEHVPNDVHSGNPAQGGGAGQDDIQISSATIMTWFAWESSSPIWDNFFVIHAWISRVCSWF